MEFLIINGTHGEGGGQIIRSAVTLSCITQKPIHLQNIRKNRKIPGLRAQHLTTIKILQKITNAEVLGLEIGSTELKFIPNSCQSLELTEDVGTAGSISLIIQSIIPVVSYLQKKIKIRIKGGTDVPWSPTMDYSINVLREVYSRIGIKFSLKILKRGYYSKGGGEVELEVFPSKIKSINFSKRTTNCLKLNCTFSKIDRKKIQKEISEIETKLKSEKFSIDSFLKNEEALDSGASILIYCSDDSTIMGVDGLFNKQAGKFDLDYEKIKNNPYAIDENLADMLVVPASLAEGKTTFQVTRMTEHLETNLFVTSKITGCRYGIGKISDGYEVIIEGMSNTSIK